MLRALLFIAGIFTTVYGNGEFIVLNYPKSASFKGHDAIKESLLPEVHSAVLGFSTEQDSNWQGLYLLDPFNLAHGIVTLSVDGIADIGYAKGQSFKLQTDASENTVYEETARRIESRYPEEQNIYRIDLSDGIEAISNIEAFSSVKNVKPQKTNLNTLKLTREEDRQFLEEYSLLSAIVDNLDNIAISNEYSPALIWLKMSSLHALSDIYGENSTEVKEAKSLLANEIEKLAEASNKLFDGRVLTSIITSDSVHTRLRRQATNNKERDETTDKYNLADQYNDDFPVIFNIIFWFGVIMIFTLLAICLFIANMDPGRDSIIYRMTSTRMKKDN